MSIQISREQRNQTSEIDSGKPVWDDNSRERRNYEIMRRLHGLQVRRDHLERELDAVKNCLRSLDRQMQNNVAYKQILNPN